MLCKVIDCVGHVSANTKPHQLCWGYWACNIKHTLFQFHPPTHFPIYTINHHTFTTHTLSPLTPSHHSLSPLTLTPSHHHTLSPLTPSHHSPLTTHTLSPHTLTTHTLSPLTPSYHSHLTTHTHMYTFITHRYGWAGFQMR